jgi:hypothetical protein
VERQIALFRERAFCLWKLSPKQGGGLIGFCGLQPLPETSEIEIGWWLARAWWGRGLATEAARVALRDGFERAGFKRIVAGGALQVGGVDRALTAIWHYSDLTLLRLVVAHSEYSRSIACNHIFI